MIAIAIVRGTEIEATGDVATEEAKAEVGVPIPTSGLPNDPNGIGVKVKAHQIDVFISPFSYLPLLTGLYKSAASLNKIIFFPRLTIRF